MDWINTYLMLALNLLVPAAIIYFIWRQLKNRAEQKDEVMQHFNRKLNDLEEKVDELLQKSDK
jgi:preprotein translocase subunit YajC